VSCERIVRCHSNCYRSAGFKSKQTSKWRRCGKISVSLMGAFKWNVPMPDRGGTGLRPTVHPIYSHRRNDTSVTLTFPYLTGGMSCKALCDLGGYNKRDVSSIKANDKHTHYGGLRRYTDSYFFEPSLSSDGSIAERGLVLIVDHWRASEERS